MIEAPKKIRVAIWDEPSGPLLGSVWSFDTNLPAEGCENYVSVKALRELIKLWRFDYEDVYEWNEEECTRQLEQLIEGKS